MLGLRAVNSVASRVEHKLVATSLLDHRETSPTGLLSRSPPSGPKLKAAVGRANTRAGVRFGQ
eukprot:4109491-Prymnesium_polylepis.1